MAEKFDFPKIFSEQYKHDMGPWVTEKSEYSLRALLELRKDLLKVEDKIDEKTLEYIHSDLSGAIYDITKLYSFSLGTNFEPGDPSLIFDKLDDGFEELQVKYGILDKTKKQIEKEELDNFLKKEKEKKDDFIKKVDEFLDLEQCPGRTFLQELLDTNLDMLNAQTINGRLFSKIENELYRVANGELSWAEFVSDTKKLMKYLDKNY